MKVTYVSGELNHHISGVCKELYALLKEDFAFIATEPAQKGKDTFQKGYAFYQAEKNGNGQFPWYKAVYDMESEAACQKLIDSSDAVIIANTSDKWIRNRLRDGKLTFRAHERWYKTKLPWYRMPRTIAGGWLHHGRYPELYMLCASAYTAADTYKIGCFRNKTYKWGYFPEFCSYAVCDYDIMKNRDKPVILWVGRLIDYKHAEDAVSVCAELKQKGYDFALQIVGDGPEKQKLQRLAEEKNLKDVVTFVGQLPPDGVRAYMEKASIFLFTSDFQEGWGAVLNEAMNSMCAVVASHAIGAVPFLLEDGKNGIIYRYGENHELYEKLASLLDAPDRIRTLGLNAYETIEKRWNAKTAAVRFLKLAEDILNGKPEQFTGYESGICSKAPIIKNDWF